MSRGASATTVGFVCGTVFAVNFTCFGRCTTSITRYTRGELRLTHEMRSRARKTKTLQARTQLIEDRPAIAGAMELNQWREERYRTTSVWSRGLGHAG